MSFLYLLLKFTLGCALGFCLLFGLGKSLQRNHKHYPKVNGGDRR